MEPFMALGAHGAESAGVAVLSSPVTLICLDGYAAARSVLADRVSSLTGKTIIQLSTGTPREAQEMEEWLKGLGAYYLDGAILGSPSTIGTEKGLILLSGSEAAFERSRSVVKCLVGDVRYVGLNVGAAATLDLAWLCQRFGLFLGLAHGARLCEAQNVDLTLLATMFPSGHRSRRFLETVAHHGYENPHATLDVWNKALKRILDTSKDAGIGREIPEFISAIFEKAIKTGYGGEDVAAIVKVLR
jgi:3-hydroxyisobutyrate dehydrogenase-like beta-hydroxyacid dehydrogenase